MNGFTTPYDGSRLSAGDFELPLGPPVAPLARRGATRPSRSRCSRRSPRPFTMAWAKCSTGTSPRETSNSTPEGPTPWRSACPRPAPSTFVVCLARTPAVLGNPAVIPGVGVTHLRYPVRKA